MRERETKNKFTIKKIKKLKKHHSAKEIKLEIEHNKLVSENQNSESEIFYIRY